MTAPDIKRLRGRSVSNGVETEKKRKEVCESPQGRAHGWAPLSVGGVTEGAVWTWWDVSVVSFNDWAQCGTEVDLCFRVFCSSCGRSQAGCRPDLVVQDSASNC